MHKMLSCLRALWLMALFQVARIVFTLTRRRVRGALVAVWHKGLILVVRKSYRKGWSVPGGLLKKGESRQQGAVRELFEEVGVRMDQALLHYVAEVPGDLGPGDRAHLFEVKLADPVDVRIDGWEIVEAEFVTPQTALGRVLNQDLRKYLQKHTTA